MPIASHSGPLFFDWNTPWLPHLAEMLLTTWTNDKKNVRGDFSDTVIVLSSKRAGRRLLELLALQATQEKIILIPPRILTLREAIPLLLPLREKSWSEAGKYARHLAWAEAAQELALPSSHHDNDPLYGLAEELAEQLGAHGVDFNDVGARIGALYPESADREELRWEALAALQKKYRAHLHEWGLLDPSDALRLHLSEGVFKNNSHVLVVGVIDAPHFFEPFFEKIQPTIFVIAPQHHALGFDAHGKLIPSYWLEHAPALEESQILSCDRNEDQAEELVRLIKSTAQPSQTITIVAQSEAIPLLRDRLEAASLQLHWAGGLPFYHSRLDRLLKVAADFVTRKDPRGPSFQAVQALLRHPDIERHVPEAEIFLKKLDRFEREYLPSLLDYKSFPELLDLEKNVNLSATPATLGVCVTQIRSFLLHLLGDEKVSGSTFEGHYFLGCLEKVLQQLEELEELSKRASGSYTISEVTRVLLEVLASESVPEREEPEAIESVGWLELAADDAPCAIVTSCQEGFLPRSLPKHPLLPEGLCKAFQIGDNTTFLARDLYLLHVINESRELRLIAPRYNARGELARPSRLLLWGCPQEALPERVLKLIQPSRMKEEKISSLKINQHSQLCARPVGQESIDRITVTSLRTYLQSPRLFYLQHVLKLQEVLAAPQEMGSNHFGILIHRVLAAFASEPSLAQSTDSKLLAGWLRKKLLDVAHDYFSSATSPVIPLQLEEAAKSLEGFAAAQAAHCHAGWRIIATEPFLNTKAPPLEEKIILPDGRSILLQGRIDRVDWHPQKERWLLIDYKTSNSKSWERATPDAMHYQKKEERIVWRDLQLPLYLKLLPRLESILKSAFPLPTPENTDLCYFQLPFEWEKARLTFPFNHAMIEPAWEEAERVIGRILDHDFEELGKIDAKRMPTLAALCGIAGLWSAKQEAPEEEN